MPLLFSYGTLQQRSVQLANFGRELAGKPAILAGYTLGEIEIKDARVIQESGKSRHPILQYTGSANDRVSGSVFSLTDEELAKADDYEVADYERVSVTLVSGEPCWIYAEAGHAK